MAALKSEFTRMNDAKPVFGISRSTLYRLVKNHGIKMFKWNNISFVETDAVKRKMMQLGDQMGD